jgi:LDH2 family malate/lactate/ureidoglycolate dehydrogenase
MQNFLKFQAEALKSYIVRFLKDFEVPHKDAQIVADVLIAADLRGINSHGIIRLHTYYGNRLLKKLIDPTSPTAVLRETKNSALLDGGNGLGQIVAHRAMSLCIEKAKNVGIAAVSVKNSNHYGIAGYYAMMALEHDMIGLSMTNSQPLVVPTYGRTAMLGTNPIAVAVPSGRERPFVLDMATSIVPIGKITVYEKTNESIPAGWGIDSSGEVTESPAQVLKGGALLPLGGTPIMRGYKGYGLALLVDILSGALSGAATGSHVGHPSKPGKADVGHFFLAMDVEAFRPLKAFKADMDRMIRALKDAPKTVDSDRIYIHGEKEFELAERYAKEGIPLMAEVVKDLEKTGRELGVRFDLEALESSDE